MLDLLIQNELIFDGLGSAPMQGDIGIQNGTIVTIASALPPNADGAAYPKDYHLRLLPVLPRTIKNRSTRKCDRIGILLQPQLQHFQIRFAGWQFVHQFIRYNPIF